MSQESGMITNGDGGTVRAAINANLQAILSTSKGSNRPSTVYGGQLWLDDNTPSATAWTLNLYDGSEDVALALIDTTTNRASYRADSVGVGTDSPIRPLTVASATSAEIAWQDTSRPANQRVARQWYSGGMFNFGALNDAGSSGAATFSFDPANRIMYWGQTVSSAPGIGNAVTGAVMFNDGANGNALILSRGNQSPLFLNNNSSGGIATTYNCAGSTVGSVVVYPTSTSFNTASDRRKKTYIKPFKDAGAIVDALNVVGHGWRGFPQEPRAVGVLAQEAHEVFPAAVSKGDDDPDGKEGDNGFVAWQVDYSKFVPVLLANAKEDRARIAALEARLAALEGKS